MLNTTLANIRNGLVAATMLALTFGAQADDNSALGPQGLSNGEAANIKRLIEGWTEQLHFGDIADWEKYFSKTAFLAAPGHEVVTGPGEIGALAKQDVNGGMQFSFSDWAIVGQNDLAVVYAQLIWDTEGVSDVEARRYNQMIVLRKEASGDWKIQSVIFNEPVKN